MSEANRFFTPGPASEVYAHNRDSPYREDVRRYVEHLWTAYEPLNGDTHFLSDARTHFAARTWEMLLSCALVSERYPLVKPRGDAPDICITPHEGGRTVWIELVTPELGTGADRANRIVTQKIGEHGELFQVQPEKAIVRYASAITSKARQLDEFRRRGSVGLDDIYVIAINGVLLDDYTGADPVPEVMRALYPLGDAYMQYAVGQADPVFLFGHYYRDHVTKASGAEVRTDSFLDPAFAGVSAVLFSKTSAWNPQPRCLDYMTLIHNRMAMNALPNGYFRFGREAVLEDQGIRWQQHPQISNPLAVPDAD